MKTPFKPEETGTEFLKIRRTFKQDVLLVVKKGGEISKFLGALASVLHDRAQVIALVKKRSLEIKNLDETTTKEDVVSALRGALNKIDLDVSCRQLTRFGSTKVA